MKTTAINTDSQNDVNHEEHKESKLSLPARLLAFIHGLDSEFPLSGGETNHELHVNGSYIGHEIATRVKDVDVYFPLSGGH